MLQFGRKDHGNDKPVIKAISEMQVWEFVPTCITVGNDNL
jgi:hypothetical protein